MKKKSTHPIETCSRAAGLSLRVTAAYAGLSPQMLARYIAGESCPRLDSARNLAAFLSFRLKRLVTVDELFPAVLVKNNFENS